MQIVYKKKKNTIKKAMHLIDIYMYSITSCFDFIILLLFYHKLSIFVSYSCN